MWVVKERDELIRILGFLIVEWEGGVVINWDKKIEGEVSFGSKIRNLDLGMFYLRCLFYI